jgi:hypothetical protein
MKLGIAIVAREWWGPTVGFKRCPCRHALPSRVTFLAVSSAKVVRCFGVRRSPIHLLKGIHWQKNKTKNRKHYSY